MILFACPCGLCDADELLRQTHNRWRAMLSVFNEHQARLFAADKALEMGRDGPAIVARITGLSPRTVENGMHELRSGIVPLGAERARQRGGGRPTCEQRDAGLLQGLEAIMEASTAGDPMSLLRWTSKSLRKIAAELHGQGHPVSHSAVPRLLQEMHYSLRGNVKSLEGKQHPDRDARFRYINEQARSFVQAQDPVISVDTKKKEKVGGFDNPGRQWRREDRVVETYDFPSLSEGPAIPYGVHDEQHNAGFVNVGMSHDTAEFAVESIRRWWRWWGHAEYARRRDMLITADNGGSNRGTTRLWKVGLQRLADRYRLTITVCHYPPGTSKWNKIEHRLFSYISINWRGEPLTSYETIIQLISHTTTKKGLRVHAELDAHDYETGIEVSDAELDTVNLEPHAFHPNWNYTIRPRH